MSDPVDLDLEPVCPNCGHLRDAHELAEDYRLRHCRVRGCRCPEPMPEREKTQQVGGGPKKVTGA